MANKILKKIPKTEVICANLYNEIGELTHIITNKINVVPKEFSLYEIKADKSFCLLGKGNNPNKLEEKFVYCKEKEKNKKK